ncbi:HNH endonuclease [Tessaracoccus flavus]|uniref:HNH endonuclease n=1 Tax=Tessaracoccus flavus TaxID=1610493 RepID=A0A1Q2CBT9_9ACTN|nr:HNH endonuclease signature motif containing protein [Tessaracoccus flavus]AQP43576.1 HNH endonuclease [Tessaracoccus flavus]SDY87595.1 HNH endonuclease [Tessaracoccus flavus]
MVAARTMKQRAAKRRQRRIRGRIQDLSGEQWADLQGLWGGCAYCGAAGVPVQKDCVLPVSRGGRYTLENVVPACRSCNASKCNSEVTGWMRRKRLDEQNFLIRHLQIRAELVSRLSE